MGECDREGGKRKGGKRKEGKRKGGQEEGGQEKGGHGRGAGYLLRAARSLFPTSMRRLRSLRKRVTYRGRKGEIERGGMGGRG